MNHFAWLALFAFFGVAGNQLFYLMGVSITTAVNAGILVTTIPIFTLIVALLLRKEKPSFIKILGVIIAFSGVAFLIDFGRFQLNENLLGDLFIIANSCCYAVYLVISKRLLNIYSSFTVITYVFIFAAILVFPVTVGSLTQINYPAIPLEGYFSLLMVLVGGTYIPYLVVTFALRNTQSTSVAIYSYLQPIIATLLSIMIVGEPLTLKLVIAAAIIIFGVSIVTFSGIFRFNKMLVRLRGFIS
jgi:drug/metabolite transporter (DMT)-like permease